MKKNFKTEKIFKILISAITCILILFLLAGCETTEKNVKKKQKSEIPDWFTNLPISDEALYATGYKKSKSLQLARDGAVDYARQELARIISVKVSTLTKQYLEEAGVDDNTQLTEFSSIVSKSLSSNVISGSTIKEIKLNESTKEENGKEITEYKCFALVELTKENLNRMIDKTLKYNSSEYSKLKADKGIEELEENLKNEKTEDYDKTKTPEYEE